MTYSTTDWRRTLWAMASVQFILGSAFSIAPPVLPLLLPTLGVGAPEAVRIWAGVVIGVTPLAAALTSAWWGGLMNRIDARWIILISCGAAAACTTLMSLAADPQQLLLLRFAMGLFGGHIAASMTIISRAAPSNRLGHALGWMSSAQLAGLLLGPLLGGAIADVSASLRAPFVMAGLAIVLVGPAVLLIPASRPKPGAAPAGTLAASATPHVRTLFVALLIAQCAIMSVQPIISLHVRELIGPRFDLATLSGLAFSIVGVGGLMASPLLGRLSDAVGARSVLLTASLIAGLFTLGQAVAPTYEWFVATRFAAGVFVAGVIPTINVLVGRNVRDADRGPAYGLTASAAFLGAFFGPAAGGLVAAHFGVASVFIGSAMLLAIAALWICIRLPRERAD